MSNKENVAVFFMLVAGVWCLATGWMDLDWIVVCNKFQFGQGLASVSTWEFCPFLIVNWWVAFELSLGRVVAGSVLLGAVSAWVLTRRK